MPTAPKPLESPIARRSALLAEMLKQGQAQQQIQGGYGELGARLLAQYLTQRASEKTDAALDAETANAALARNQSLAARVGGSIAGTPQEVGNGRLGNPFSGLVDAIRGKPAQPEVMPQATPQAPVQAAPMPTNTQEPISSPVAPMAQVEGAPLPQGGQPMAMPQAQAPAPAMAAPQAPQPAQNPLGPTEQERALIMQYLNSGDEGMIAAAEKMVQEIEMRQAQPAWTRAEFQAVNGVPGTFDPTRGWSPQEGGVPQAAQNQTFVAGENNEYGAPAGTLLQRSPTGVVSVVNRPDSGYERVGGTLRAERGGPADATANNQGLGNVRQLRTDFRRETEGYREAQTGYRKVQAAAADMTGASDVALIFGFMKTIDPGSTVREGEAATVQNTGSVPDRIQGLYNRALAGERLTPSQRAEIVQAAEGQFQTYQAGYDDAVASYGAIARQYGFDPSIVFGDTVSPPQRQTRPQQRQNPPTQPRPAPRPQQRPQTRERGNSTEGVWNPATGRIEWQ